MDLQAVVDTDQCIRYMAKCATKGELRSQCASEILNACVNRLDNTDMASSALRRAMMQVAGERGIGSQDCTYASWKNIVFLHLFVSLCLTGWKSKSSCWR